MKSGEANFRTQLVIPGELPSLERVHRWVLAQIRAIGLPEPDVHNILLATSEAVTNAIRHGSHEEATKLVVISIETHGRSIEIAVEDEGDGFDINVIPDPTQGERLHEPGGRGIFLLRSLADDLHIHRSRQGTRVVFSFGMKQ